MGWPAGAMHSCDWLQGIISCLVGMKRGSCRVLNCGGVTVNVGRNEKKLSFPGKRVASVLRFFRATYLQM